MILTVNIHPTAIKVARSGQGGRNVALEMTDATGSVVASIFPGSADGWDRLVSLAIEGRAMQEQADTDHAIAGDVDEQTTRVPLDVVEDEPRPDMFVVVNVEPDGRRVTVSDPRPKALAELFAEREAPYFAGRLEVAPARPEDLDDADGER